MVIVCTQTINVRDKTLSGLFDRYRYKAPVIADEDSEKGRLITTLSNQGVPLV